MGGTKKREPWRAPLFPLWGGVLRLESEAKPELQLAHAVRSVRSSIGFDRVNYAAAGAVDAGVALSGAEAKHRMIEHVVGIKPELRFHPLGDREVLGKRHIREEGVRAAEPVAASVADVTASGQGKRTGSRPRKRAGIHVGRNRAT